MKYKVIYRLWFYEFIRSSFQINTGYLSASHTSEWRNGQGRLSCKPRAVGSNPIMGDLIFVLFQLVFMSIISYGFRYYVKKIIAPIFL